MIKKSILFVLILFPSIALCQKGIYFKLGGGSSFPLTDLSSTIWTNETNCGGFAKTGYHLFAEGQYFFSPAIGISLSGYFNEMRLKNQVLHDAIFNTHTDSMLTIESGAWQFNTFSFGPVYRISISDKASFQLKAAVSYSETAFPYLKIIKVDTNGTPSSKTREIVKSAAFGGMAGIGFNYMMNENIYFNINTEAFYCKPLFNFSSNSLSLNAFYLNLGVGFTYYFTDEDKEEEEEEY